MAIKEWIIIARSKEGNYINWGKKLPLTQAIRIEKSYNLVTGKFHKSDTWSVLSGKRYGYSNTSFEPISIIKSNLKYKQQALAYAKQYMKTH